MNKVKSFCMLVAILLPLATLSAQDIWDGSVATAFAGGSGTADNPYQISNGAELAYLAKITNENANQTDGKYYKLTDDIVLNENVLNKNYELNGTPTHEWTPIADIGYYSIESSSFMGDFDGDGHTISGLYVTRSEGIYPYSSLFGSIGGQAVIHDLAVIDSYAYCTYTAALIVANMTNTSAVRRCYADGLVDGNEYIGLLVGTTTNGMSVTIEDCYAKGTNNYTYGGGFIGYTGGGTVNRCFSVGKLPNGGHSDIGSYSYSLNYSKFYYDNTVTSAPSLHGTGKTTEEMQSEAFAELLGEPFVYVADNYPYIDGLPAIGEKSADKSGFRLNSGTLENGDGCSFRYYRELSGTTPKKMTRRAESGTKVYLKLMLNKRKMLGTGGVILKDEAEQSVALTEEAENVWSFTMPDSHVTVSAAFVTDDSASELWDGSVADSFAGGTGTESDPYLITNGSELAYLSKITKNNPSQTQGVYYKLMSNIVLNENVLTEDFQLNGTPENSWISVTLKHPMIMRTTRLSKAILTVIHTSYQVCIVPVLTELPDFLAPSMAVRCTTWPLLMPMPKARAMRELLLVVSLVMRR